MPDDRVEYRFILESYTPETIPQTKIAQYLADLADLHGAENAVHFVRVEPSSLALVSSVDADADSEVSDRLATADTPEAAPDVQRPYESLIRHIQQDGGPARIERERAPVLRFPTGERVEQSLAYGPFWQQGHLSGTVILIGGKTDRASVKIQDANGDVHTCKTNRETAKRLREYLYEQPIRVLGQGRWRRENTGQWRLEQFDIENFTPLDDSPLSDAIARLRAVEGKWKDRPDPLAEIDEIRRGN